jgi:hypothetical protein
MLVQTHLDLVGERTAVDGYRVEADKLRESIAKGKAAEDSLMALHRKVQDFQQVAVSLLFNYLFFLYCFIIIKHTH